MNPNLRPLRFLLDPGDLMFLSTDGLLENSVNNSTALTVRVLRGLLTAEVEPEDMKQRIQAAYHLSLGGSTPGDDCTFAVIRRKAA